MPAVRYRFTDVAEGSIWSGGGSCKAVYYIIKDGIFVLQVLLVRNTCCVLTLLCISSRKLSRLLLACPSVPKEVVSVLVEGGGGGLHGSSVSLIPLMAPLLRDLALWRASVATHTASMLCRLAMHELDEVCPHETHQLTPLPEEIQKQLQTERHTLKQQTHNTALYRTQHFTENNGIAAFTTTALLPCKSHSILANLTLNYLRTLSR